MEMANQSTGATVKQIQALEERRCQAMIDKDMKTLEALYADELVYTHSSATVDDKKSYLAGIASGKFDYKSINRITPDIRILGDTAVVTGRVEISVRAGGADRQLNSRYTIVWVKRGGNWQAVTWQSTPVPKT
jgi:ketosteroid isomerase-like protein